MKCLECQLIEINRYKEVICTLTEIPLKHLSKNKNFNKLCWKDEYLNLNKRSQAHNV